MAEGERGAPARLSELRRIRRLGVFVYGLMGLAIAAGVALWVWTSMNRAQNDEIRALVGRTAQLAQAVQPEMADLAAGATLLGRLVSPRAAAREYPGVRFTTVAADSDFGAIVALRSLGAGSVTSRRLEIVPLTRRWSTLDVPEGSSVALIGPDMRMLVRWPWEPRFANMDLTDGPLGRAMAAAGYRAGVVTLTAELTDGARRYVAWEPLQGGYGYVALGVPEAAVKASWWASYGPALSVYGAAVTLFYLLGGVLLRSYLVQAGARLRTLDTLRRRNAQLQAKTEENKLLVEGINRSRNAITITDREGRIRWANRTFEALTGHRLEAVRGRDPEELLQATAGDGEALDRLAAARRAGRRERVELLNRRAGGETFWSDVELAPIRDAAGRVSHFIAIASDITERKRLAELVDSLNRIQQDFVASLSGGGAIDATPFLRDVLEQVIALTESRAGLLCEIDDDGRLADRAAVLPRGVEAPARSLAHEMMAKALDSREPSIRAPTDEPDENGVRGAILALPLVVGERSIGALALMHRTRAFDRSLVPRILPIATALAHCVYTARLVNEETQARRDVLAARRAAEHAARAKTQFLAQMSHDLRTPLNAILGWSEAMTGGHLALSPPRVEAMARQINLAGEQLRRLVEEILDLSQAEQGRADPPRPVDLRGVAADVLSTLRPAFFKHDRRLKLDLPRGLSRVMGEDRAAMKLLQNALANALEHGAGGKRVELRLAPSGPGWVELSIWDDGPGFPDMARETLFEPFHDDYESGVAQSKGFGLGMAIIKASAQRMGGDVYIADSAVGADLRVRLKRAELPALTKAG